MRPHRKSFGYGLTRYGFTLLVILALLGMAMPAMASDAGWYDTGWGYRKAITIDRTKVVTDQKDFPVMIILGSDSDLAARAQNTGNDLIFTLSDGTTKLPVKVESFTKSNGALVAWVKVPLLSSIENTVLYMYFGNPGASKQQDTPSAWTDTYKGNWKKKDIISWVQTELNNHNSPSTFYSVGTAEAQPLVALPASTAEPTVTPTPTPAPVADSAPTQTQVWNDCGWSYLRAITIDKTKVVADQTDFPILISIPSDPGLAAHAQPTGNDILFTLSDETNKVPHKIESYTSTTGALVAWVKVPTLSSTVNTVLYLYYGNPSAPAQQDTMNTWSYRYKGAWSRKAIASWVQTKYNNQMYPFTFLSIGPEVFQPQSCATPVPTTTPTVAPTPGPTTDPVDPTPTPTPVDPTPIPPTVEPTPTPTPAFTCPADSYRLVTPDGVTAGCVAVTNDWTIEPTTDETTGETTDAFMNTLSVSYTMADTFCLKSADIATTLTEVMVPDQYTQSFDPLACTNSYTFSIPLGDTGDIPHVYLYANGVVQKVTSGTSSADIDVLIPENPIEYLMYI